MSLRTFCLRIFQHCPLLASFSVENHMRAFEEFLQYKTRVPVRGAILLNEAMDSTVLVKGWKKGANWSFPRGKINKDEDDLDCAIREVYEETGFDIREAGLVPKNDEIKYIEISMREQQIRLYVFRDVPMETNFHPRTRKEISKIQWYKLSELPAFRKKGNQQPDDAAAASNANKFYMVAPFLVPLKKWVMQQKKRDVGRATSNYHLATHAIQEEPATEDDISTQTEPINGPPTATAAVNNLESATRELQRLLKVQPPTQGIQLSPSGSGAGNSGKGEALMAILQSKGSSTQHPPGSPLQPPPIMGNNQIPPLPFGFAYNNPPQAHHHHPTQIFPPNSYQPPPNFPISSNMNQNIPAAYYNQVRAPGQMPPQHHGHVRNVSNMGSGYQRGLEPVLLHPQPLPPQVQQSRLTRSILATPNLPETTGGVKVDGSYSSFNSQPRIPQGPPQSQQTTTHVAPPQMTSHSMSLLNALKSGDRAVERKPAPAGPSQGANDTPQTNFQPAPWSNLPPSQGQQPTGPLVFPNPTQPLRPLQNGAAQSMASQTASAFSAKPHPPTDKHRSALLDMFKKQAPPSPTSSEATVRPNKAHPELSTRAGEEAKRSLKSQPPAEANVAATQANGRPVVMNPELNLPYRAFQILSRPVQRENQPSQKPEALGRPGGATSNPKEAKHMISPNMPSPKSSARPTPRTEAAESNGLACKPSLPQPANTAHDHTQYQGSSISHGAPVFPAAGMLQRRQDGNPEQKQKLLSLFGKPQPSPSLLTGEGKGKEVSMPERATSGTPRSLIASLTSAGGDGAQGSAAQSRRGSQTPISPADRDFLLGFLQSVTSKTH